MNRSGWWWRIALLGGVAALAAGCGRSTKQQEKPVAKREAQYPEPRFPSYLKPPQSIAEVMPQARVLARNRSGFQGWGLGVAKPGETIAIVTGANAEDMIVQAIKRALEERGIKVNVLHDYELVHVSREDALAYRKARQTYTAEQGYMEAANWIENQFPDPDAVTQWLKQRRPDLYDYLFPKNRELSDRLKQVRDKFKGDAVGQGIVAYLRTHKEVRGVFWGKGGGTSLRRAMHPLESQFLGLFTADNRWDVMSALGSYPGDVWQLAEEQAMEPLVYVDKVQITDPEGTNIWADINQVQAQNWSRGAYQRGHLYMFPNQATGRFGYSVVDYPSFQKGWLPREPLVLVNGVIAGTNGHGGFYPRWEVYFKDGYVKEVKGGGIYGDTLREFLRYPHINDLAYPFMNPEHPGFWYLYEVASGTHPKAFRNPLGLEQGTAVPERLRSGVLHWGLGITLQHDPNSLTKSQKLLDFTAQYNLPRDHGFHTHSYFATYKVHLRNADKWVSLLDRGRLVSLDHPEVRALASRYGDPDQLLTEDWRPEVPGINASGQYTDYASDPWKTVKRVIDRVIAGTYDYFYPPAPNRPARATRAAAAN